MSIYRQTAFSLIEALIALMLLSFIAISLTAWQLKACLHTLIQYQEFVAIQILQGIAAETHSAEPIVDWSAWQNRASRELLDGQLTVKGNRLSLSWKAETGIWYCQNPAIAERACLAVELAT